MLALDEVHIVDDGGQRCLDIVGHVRDQVGLQAFALYLFGKSCLQTVTDTVQSFGEFRLQTREIIDIHLVARLPGGEFFDGGMDLVRLVRIPVDKVEYQKVSGDPGDHHEDERHELEYGIFMMEDHECPNGDHEYVVCKIQHKAYCDPVAECALGECFCKIMQKAVLPECLRLVSADQAEEGQDDAEIQVSEGHQQVRAVPVI